MKSKIYVWDPLVRIFHWSLVLAFILCYVTGDEENLTHVYSGYVILGLVAFRIIWGLIGSKYARFSDFICSPAKTIVYLKGTFVGGAKKYIGHNPAGGWMVIALLTMLLLTGLTGLKVYGLEGYGPLAENSVVQETNVSYSVGRGYDGYDDESDEDEEDFWEEIHEFLANFTVFLIALHITGVIVASIRENQNLIKAMLTGYKKQ